MKRALVALLWIASAACGERGSGAETSSVRTLAPELRPVARALEERRFEYGRELAREYLAAHPDDAQALFLLGMSYFWTGNYAAARPGLERALELQPALTVAHDPLGYSLFLLGDLAGARRAYETFLAVAPEEPKAHYGLALIELEESALDAAAAHLRRAIELFGRLESEDPGQAAARRPELAECHARLGEVHFARGEHESARAELLAATDICPGNISAFYTLSLVHRRLGEDELADRAAEHYESARRALIAGQGSAGR